LTSDEAYAIAAGDNDDRIAALRKVLTHNDPALPAFLEALSNDSVKVADHHAYIVDGEDVKEAATGAPAKLPDDAEDVINNNRMSSEIDAALAAGKLTSPNRDEREEAIDALDEAADESKLPIVEKALAAETDSLITTGGGTINLGTEQIDLLLKPKPKKASLASLAFPIRVSGPLTAPSAGIDREGAAVGIATAVGGAALTGGVGVLLPLMSTGNGAAASGGCSKLAATAAEDKGGVGGVTDTAKGVGQGVGGAVDSVTKGLGGLFGK
jgi:hypothetical protein